MAQKKEGTPGPNENASDKAKQNWEDHKTEEIEPQEFVDPAPEVIVAGNLDEGNDGQTLID